MMEELNRKRVRDDSDESELDSLEVKRLRFDLLDGFDESDLCTTSEDLDSFMKSFQEEISGSGSGSTSPAPAVIDLTSESGESRQELGYLLGASDDELGLPPSIMQSPSAGENQVEAELVRVSSESDELSELWRFDDQITGFDSFEFGCESAITVNGNGNSGEFVALEGLFDYSDIGYGIPEFL